jgi:hypothetical protein
MKNYLCVPSATVSNIARVIWRRSQFVRLMEVCADTAAFLAKTSAMPGRSILQRPWRATRPCRCCSEYDGVPVSAGLVGFREKSQTYSIVALIKFIVISLLTPPAQPFREQDWRHRGAASCRGPDAQHGLADAAVSVMRRGWVSEVCMHKLV